MLHRGIGYAATIHRIVPLCGRRLAGLLVALMLNAGLSAGVHAQDAKAVSALDSIFPASERRSDFIFAIDRSLSMKRHWPRVSEAIVSFIRALPDSDHVSIVLFGKSATTDRILPRTISAESRSALARGLSDLGPPTKDPVSGESDYTDLGAAFASVTDEINRPGAHRLQFVFLLTDFSHEPASGSAFASRDAAKGSWPALIQKAALLRQDHALQVVGLILPVDQNAKRDIGLAEAVFGKVRQVEAAEGNAMEEFFRKFLAEAGRLRYRVLAEHDMSFGWAWQVSPGLRSTTVEVTSKLKRVPSRIEIDSIILEGGQAHVTGNTTIVLQPGKQSRFEVRARSCEADPPIWKWLLTPGLSHRTANGVRFFGSVFAEPKEQWIRVGLSDRAPLGIASTAMFTVVACGAPIAWQVLALLLLVLLALFSWKRWLRPPTPINEQARRLVLIGLADTATASSSQVVVDLQDWNRAVCRVGTAAGGNDIRVAVEQVEFSLLLISRRPRFPGKSPSRGLYIARVSGSVEYHGERMRPDGKGVTIGWHPLSTAVAESIPVRVGATRVRVGGERGYQVRIEPPIR